MPIRRLALASGLALVTACSGTASTGAPPPTAPEPSSSSGTSSAPTPPPSAPSRDADVLVVVPRSSGPVELRRVRTADRASSLVRELAPPQDGLRLLDVAVGEGREPLVCATWYDGPDRFEVGATRLHCYAWPSVQGSAVEGVDRPAQVAIAPDGRRLAWSMVTPGEVPVFSTGTLRDGALTAVDRWRGDESAPEDGFSGVSLQDLAWSDEDHVVVSTGVMADAERADLLHVDVGRAARDGWLEDGFAVPVPEGEPERTTRDAVTSATAATALARLWVPLPGGNTLGPDRAVRLDLASGEVLETVATAADDRVLVSVSGRPEAVVYVTAASDDGTPDDVKGYLRLEGEPRGTPITGLPQDALDVLAQG